MIDKKMKVDELIKEMEKIAERAVRFIGEDVSVVEVTGMEVMVLVQMIGYCFDRVFFQSGDVAEGVVKLVGELKRSKGYISESLKGYYGVDLESMEFGVRELIFALMVILFIFVVLKKEKFEEVLEKKLKKAMESIKDDDKKIIN